MQAQGGHQRRRKDPTWCGLLEETSALGRLSWREKAAKGPQMCLEGFLASHPHRIEKVMHLKFPGT